MSPPDHPYGACGRFKDHRRAAEIERFRHRSEVGTKGVPSGDKANSAPAKCFAQRTRRHGADGDLIDSFVPATSQPSPPSSRTPPTAVELRKVAPMDPDATPEPFSADEEPTTTPPSREADVRGAIVRLSRPYPAGGDVIERAAILAEGPDSAAIMAWVLANADPAVEPAPKGSGGGLYGTRMSGSSGVERAPRRYVIPAGLLDAQAKL